VSSAGTFPMNKNDILFKLSQSWFSFILQISTKLNLGPRVIGLKNFNTTHWPNSLTVARAIYLRLYWIMKIISIRFEKQKSVSVIWGQLPKNFGLSSKSFFRESISMPHLYSCCIERHFSVKRKHLIKLICSAKQQVVYNCKRNVCKFRWSS